MSIEQPKWMQDLVAICKHQDLDERLNGMANYLGFQPLSDLPRPGEVAGWEVKEWEKWLKVKKFVEGERTKHGTDWTHTQFPTVRVKVPSSIGDYRAAMNMFSDLRRAWRIVYERLCSAVLVCIASAERTVESGEKTYENYNIKQLETAVVAMVGDDDDNGLSSRMHEQNITDLSEENSENLKRVLKKLNTFFGVAAREALRRAKYSESQIETVVTHINKSIPFRTSTNALRDLVEVLETEEEAERVGKEQKRKEREAREAAKTQAPTAVIINDATRHASEVRKLRECLEGDYAKACRLADELTTFLVSRHQAIDRLPFPHPPTGDSEATKKQVADLSKELTTSRDNGEALKTQMDLDQQAHEATKEALRKVERELLDTKELLNDAAHTDPFRAKFEGLVTALKPLLFGSGDMETMLTNLSEAKKVLRGAEVDLNTLRIHERKAS